MHIFYYARLFIILLWIKEIKCDNGRWQRVFSFFSEFIKGPSDITKDIPVTKLYKEYDFIIIGAGSGGAVLANRLTEISEWKVLLIEAGSDENTITDIPFMSAVLSSTEYSWKYQTEPQDKACLGLRNKRSKWPKGRGMGGSSIINGMIYTRGHPYDYDSWASLGNYGWEYKNIYKYFLKSENAYGDFAEHNNFHSKDGFLDVQRVPHKTILVDSFLKSGLKYDYLINDPNSPDPGLGFSLFQATMRNGSRCSVNKAFLRPIRHRNNLHVSKLSHVTRILINPHSKIANGVEFSKYGRFYAVYATKEIILSAGVINSPHILLLSGIGNKKHLDKFNIPLIKHLPGVGENLYDHIAFSGLSFLINESLAITGADVTSISSILQYVYDRNGVLTNIGVGEALAFIRTKISKLPYDYPDLELMFGATHLASDTSPIISTHIGIKDDIMKTVYGPIGNKHGWSIYPILMRPESKGYLRLNSKNPFKKPLLYANYLDSQHDLNTIIEGIKFIIKLSETEEFERYDSKLHDIPLPACKHLTDYFNNHIIFTDEYWACAVRQLTTTVHHQCCTNKMGPRSDDMAVVDPELRVFGIQGLRVVDASIMPHLPAAHTNAPVIMIAERASDLIKKFYDKL